MMDSPIVVTYKASGLYVRRCGLCNKLDHTYVPYRGL